MTTHLTAAPFNAASVVTSHATSHAAEQLLIHRAGSHDAATVRELLLELASHEHSAHAVHASVDDWARMLSNPDVVVLLARTGDRPVGYVSAVRQLNLWVGNHICAMDDLYVRAEARDRGVGGRLMAALADHASNDQLLITWGVREDNDAGHRFYRRLGATLRTKMVAAWRPREYAAYLDGRAEG